MLGMVGRLSAAPWERGSLRPGKWADEEIAFRTVSGLRKARVRAGSPQLGLGARRWSGSGPGPGRIRRGAPGVRAAPQLWGCGPGCRASGGSRAARPGLSPALPAPLI